MKHLLVIFFLLSATVYTAAQVTIGSDQVPVKGSLLDLKNIAADPNSPSIVTADKGLLLPRVHIKTVRIPNAGNNLAKTILGTNDTDNWDSAAHTALIVYNTNDCLFETIGVGPYTWTGEHWEALSSGSNNSEVSKFTDPRDGNVYSIRKFGTDAGTWMTENLRFVPKENDPKYKNFTHGINSAQGFYNQKGYMYNLGIYQTESASQIDYSPEGIERDFLKDAGIFYTLAGILNDTDILEPSQYPNGLDESQTADGIDRTPRRQGICPDGWHVPSDAEWNKLEKEVFDHPEKYSFGKRSDYGETWLPTWEYGPDTDLNPSRLGRIALLNLQACVADYNTGRYISKGFTSNNGGFAMLPVGYGYYYNERTDADRVGIISKGRGAGYMSSSLIFKTTGTNAHKPGVWTRGFYAGGTGVARTGGVASYFYPIRCKMD